MLWSMFTASFDELLEAWCRHHDLRRAGGPYRELAESRRRLDELRDSTYRLRRAFAPEPDEAREAVVTTFCTHLGESVFLYRTDYGHHDRWGHSPTGRRPMLRCQCGEPIDGPNHPAEGR